MRENTDQNNSEYGHFSRSVTGLVSVLEPQKKFLKEEVSPFCLYFHRFKVKKTIVRNRTKAFVLSTEK